jgi:hypothetical protein
MLERNLYGIAPSYNPPLKLLRPELAHPWSSIKPNRNEQETRLVRTSITHPLRIDDIPLENARLGIAFCPGKKGDSVFGAAWDRDLELDMGVVAPLKALGSTIQTKSATIIMAR